MFLLQEISRLYSRKDEMCNLSEITQDPEMLRKTQKVFEKLDSYQKSPITDEVVLTVLRTQQLEQEIFTNDD